MTDTPILTGDITVSGVGYATVRKHKRIEWAPAADITAHELATLMPLLISMAAQPMNYWEDYIPTKTKRHFKISDQ